MIAWLDDKVSYDAWLYLVLLCWTRLRKTKSLLIVKYDQYIAAEQSHTPK